MIPADTVNEQLTLMADTLDQTAITKQLATGLDECLTSYTKDKMIEIAEHGGYSVKKSHTKSRMAEDIASQMEQSFRNELAYMAKQELAVLTQLMDGPIEGNALEVFLPYSFALDAIQRGWVFLFKEKDHYTLVLPNEISQWMAALVDDNDFNTESEQHQAVFEHMTALIHLYGVFNAQIAWSAWEKRPNTPAIEKETFFDAMERMQGKLEKYEKAGELLYSAQHLNAEDAQKLHDGRTVSGYYLPSESDILFYAINEVDSRTTAYAKLKAYLQQKYPEKEEMVTHLLHEIGMNAVMDNRIQELIQYLDETMNFTFDNADEFQEFSNLYAKLSSETRKWQLKGHTPNELREAEQHARSRQRTRHTAPVKPQPVRVSKVGRNEPCPCGSGKKYKKCHGR